MYKIEVIDFKPLPEHDDLVVKIRKPSDAARLKAASELQDIPEDGPDKDRLEALSRYGEALMKACILQVSGLCGAQGEMIENADDFVREAPNELRAPVLEKVLQLSRVDQELKKKSSEPSGSTNT